MLIRTLVGLQRLMLGASALAMVAAFGCVMAGIVGRQLGLNIPGLDAYAGYAIAAALFLALPEALRRDRHIRVTLLVQRLPRAGRRAAETLAVAIGGALAGALAWYAVKLVRVSREFNDVSTGADATPLWLPQLAMAAGCIGLVLAFLGTAWRLARGHEALESDAPADGQSSGAERGE